MLPRALLSSLSALSMLTSKRLCSLSQPEAAIFNPNFRIYIIYIYQPYIYPELRIKDCRFRSEKEAEPF